MKKNSPMHLPVYAEVVLRSCVVYICILTGIRIFGKKELAQLSVIDLVFILLISNSVQNAMIGPYTGLWEGVTAAATLFFINFILKYFSYRFSSFGKLIQGDPVVLIYKGKVMGDSLKKARISEAELQAAIRQHEIRDISQVDLATLEINGNISVLSGDFKIKTEKHYKKPKAKN